MKIWQLILIVVILVPIALFVRQPDVKTSSTDSLTGKVLMEPEEIDNVGELHLVTSQGEIRLKQSEGKWGVTDKGGFPADTARIEDLFQKLNDIRLGEMVTANPQRHKEMGVSAPLDNEKPEQDNGILAMTMKTGESGKKIYFGAARQARNPDGSVGFGDVGQYIRFDGSENVFLTSSRLWLEKNPVRWLRTELIKLEQSKISRIRWPGKEEEKELLLSREVATEPLVLSELGPDMQMKTAPLDGLTRFFANLTIDDIVTFERAEELKAFEDSARLELETFDGLKLALEIGMNEVDIGQTGMVNLVKISASYSGDDSALKDRVSDLSRFAESHAYAMKNFRIMPLLLDYDDLAEKKPEENSDAEDKSKDSTEPEMVSASHILVAWKGLDRSDAERSQEEAKKLITEILEKISAGETLESLAEQHSSCPSGKSGGSLGQFGRGQMAKPFEDSAFGLGVGEVSGIVETSFGYHIIRRDN